MVHLSLCINECCGVFNVNFKVAQLQRHLICSSFGFEVQRGKPFVLFAFSVRPIGCFKDKGRRAIPQMDGRDILIRDFYRRRKDAINKCALVAGKLGYKVFSVQHQGWCATGPKAHLTYEKYGPSNLCRNGKGGPWANDVYRVVGL